MAYTRRSLASVIVLALAFCSSAFSASRAAQQNASGSQLPSIPPQELVRRTVDNELKANSSGTRYMFKDRRQTPEGSKTKLMVETNQGTVAYLIAINDKPLTQQQRAQEDQRLQGLINNAEEQNKKKKNQQSDADRVERMFRELPNAFIYTYDGVVPGSNAHQWVHLKFEPNPNYNPPSRETSVFKAMHGTMVIDPEENRLARIEANLFKEVSFGWGILGHLDKGGHFIVEQTNIGDKRWEPTYMNLQFSGKVLFFKTIDLRQIETTTDYVRVPDGLSLAQGVDILKKRVGEEYARNGQ